MKKEVILGKKAIAVALILFCVLIYANLSSRTSTGNGILASSAGSGGGGHRSVAQRINVDKNNLPIFLQSTDIVKDLPDDAEIELRLYNFNSGEREWEESYVIKKGISHVGNAENPDIVIILASKYVGELGNFCSAIQKANANGDFGYELKKGKASLSWEYKGMMKYKECFGT